MLAAGGGTARLIAGVGSCTASSLAGAEAEAVGSEILRRPRGRATQVSQSADVCLSFYLVRVQHKILQKKTPTTREQKSHDIFGKARGTKDQPTDQRTNDYMSNDYMFGPVSFRR